MSEKVVFSQLSRKFIDENDARPPRRSRWSITAWRLVTTLGYRLPGSGAHLPVG